MRCVYFEEKKISGDGIRNSLHPFLNGCQSLQLAIFYKKEKFDIIQKASIKFNHLQKDPLNWFRDKGFLHVVFKEKNTNSKPFHIINTHMNLFGKDIRYQQSLQICNYIRDCHLNSNQYPIIVTGDFNVDNYQDETIIILEEMLDLENITKEMGNTILFSNFYRDWFNKIHAFHEKQCDFTFIKNFNITFMYKTYIPGNDLYTDHEAFLLCIGHDNNDTCTFKT